MISLENFVKKCPAILAKTKALGFANLFVCDDLINSYDGKLTFILQGGSEDSEVDHAEVEFALKDYLKSELGLEVVSLMSYEETVKINPANSATDKRKHEVFLGAVSLSELRSDITLAQQFQNRLEKASVQKALAADSAGEAASASPAATAGTVFAFFNNGAAADASTKTPTSPTAADTCIEGDAPHADKKIKIDSAKADESVPTTVQTFPGA